jgi:hypothetical protein
MTEKTIVDTLQQRIGELEAEVKHYKARLEDYKKRNKSWRIQLNGDGTYAYKDDNMEESIKIPKEVVQMLINIS